MRAWGGACDTETCCPTPRQVKDFPFRWPLTCATDSCLPRTRAWFPAPEALELMPPSKPWRCYAMRGGSLTSLSCHALSNPGPLFTT